MNYGPDPQTDNAGSHRLLRVVAGLLAVFWGLVFFGLIDLLAFLQGPEFHARIVLSTGWGLLFLFLVAGPLQVVFLGPTELSAAATAAVAAVGVALVVAAILSAAPRYLFAAAGMAATALLGMRARGRQQTTWLSTWHWSPLPAVVLSVAVWPLGYYSWISARNAGTEAVTDYSAGLDHWPAQAALPVAVVLIAAAAAGHPRGWRLLAWLVTACGLWFATVCWLEPHLVASISRAWSVAVFAWSLVFVTVAHASGRPNRHKHEPQDS